jgi:hypothetical protein
MIGCPPPNGRNYYGANTDFLHGPDRRPDHMHSLFANMVFKGEELEMRTRTFVLYYSLEPRLFTRTPRKNQLKKLKLRHAYLARP